jgi:hypothetical protein
LKELKVTAPMTDVQKILNDDIAYLEQNLARFVTFYVFLKNHFEDLMRNHGPEPSCSNPAKKWTIFYSKCHAFLQSVEYQSACKTLFAQRIVNTFLCGSIETMIRKRTVASFDSAILPQQEAGSAIVSEFAFGKIRYVGGCAVAKVKYHNSNIIRKEIGELGMIASKNAKVKVDLLQTIIVSQVDADLSKFPSSIIDIKRKQNLSCGLTNISDEAFEFFLELEKYRIPLYSISGLRLHGENLLNHIHDRVISNTILFKQWVKLFVHTTCAYAVDSETDDCADILSDITEGASALTDLYRDVSKAYLGVTDSEFRKKLLEDLGKSKSMEHRKKVLTKGKTQSSGCTDFSMETFLKATNKDSYHLKLKAALLANEDILKKLTKKQIILLGRFYNVKLRTADTKDVLCNALKATVVECDVIPKPDYTESQ